MNEPKILKKLIGYNFLPTIITSFQDYENLYLITNYYEGSNLYNYKDKIMSEEQIKFISACIIQSLFYLRKENIINRDVKMENIIMDKNRYLNLIDFSFSINYGDKNNKNTFFLISPRESPPETQNYSLYDYNSDYYRIGVIIYYLIFKKYINLIKIEKNINEIEINKNNLKNYSTECIDFLNKLIINDFRKRIGFKNINELKMHSWFKGFDWTNFEKKKINSPLSFMKNNKMYCKKININHKKKLYIINSNKKLIGKYDFINKELGTKILKKIK